jgi:hypothetical protein
LVFLAVFFGAFFAVFFFAAMVSILPYEGQVGINFA